jgi:hypothetical protein
MTIRNPKVRAALSAFVDAAHVLHEAWAIDDHDELDVGYPRCLPSFDDFLPQLIAWRDHDRTRKPAIATVIAAFDAAIYASDVEHAQVDEIAAFALDCARRVGWDWEADRDLAAWCLKATGVEAITETRRRFVAWSSAPPATPARMVTAKAVIVELHTSAGRVPAYSMIDGPDAGVSFIASDTRAARLRMGEDVNATYCPGDQFARLAPEEH